jgi:hypothetical protein
MKTTALSFVIFITAVHLAMGQNDSTRTEKFYQTIKDVSQKSSLGYFLYETVFNVPDKRMLDSLIGVQHAEEGLIIRNIIIHTRDPFGASLMDTVVSARSVVQKVGNRLHTKTKQVAIEIQLLFQKGDTTDLLKLAETERIIRNCGYIRDVAIRVNPICSDSADILVETIDQWSFSTSLSISTSTARWKFKEYDLFGLGHRFGNTFEWNRNGFELEKPEFEGYYQIPNVAGSFTSMEINYLRQSEKRSLGVSIDKPFYSTISNWAGGAWISRNSTSDSLRITSDLNAAFSREWNQYGAWIGKSFPLKKGRTKEERSTRLVVGTSYYLLENVRLNTNDNTVATALSSSRTALLSIGFSNRSYKIDRFIFQAGDEEDVPSGRKVQVTSGHENKHGKTRRYLGAVICAGGYIGEGFYLSSSIDWIAFSENRAFEDTRLQLRMFGFTPLIGKKDLSFRILGTFDYTRLGNQSYYRPIGLDENELLPGLESDGMEGTERLAGSVTLALFNPLEIIGFKITPILYFGAGFLGNGERDILNSSYQSALGAGLVITNEYLSQSDFKLVVAFFPNQPDFWKFGGVSAWEYGFSDFDFQKPVANY